MTLYLITKTKALIGRVVGNDDKGWRFHPNTTAHQSSRRDWPTANKAIPDWAFNMSDDLLTQAGTLPPHQKNGTRSAPPNHHRGGTALPIEHGQAPQQWRMRRCT